MNKGGDENQEGVEQREFYEALHHSDVFHIKWGLGMSEFPVH